MSAQSDSAEFPIIRQVTHYAPSEGVAFGRIVWSRRKGQRFREGNGFSRKLGTVIPPGFCFIFPPSVGRYDIVVKKIALRRYRHGFDFLTVNRGIVDRIEN